MKKLTESLKQYREENQEQFLLERYTISNSDIAAIKRLKNSYFDELDKLTIPARDFLMMFFNAINGTLPFSQRFNAITEGKVN